MAEGLQRIREATVVFEGGKEQLYDLSTLAKNSVLNETSSEENSMLPIYSDTDIQERDAIEFYKANRKGTRPADVYDALKSQDNYIESLLDLVDVLTETVELYNNNSILKDEDLQEQIDSLNAEAAQLANSITGIRDAIFGVISDGYFDDEVAYFSTVAPTV